MNASNTNDLNAGGDSLAPLALAPSQIRHRRYAPKAHAFNYTLNYLWFDAEQIEQICAKPRLWSASGFNVLVLNANDFLSQYSGNSIREKIADVLQQKNHVQLSQNTLIRVLALPRCLGKRFNSVVFYYVYPSANSALNHNTANIDHLQSQPQSPDSVAPQWILTEITNTPWDERVVYVHDCRDQVQQHGSYQGAQFGFQKAFHVSPFMPMNLHYRWHFHWSATQHFIHMQLIDQQKLCFDATIQFELKPLTQISQQNLYAVQYMLQPVKMLAAIYLQALRLWLKRIPFFPHPHKTKDEKPHHEN